MSIAIARVPISDVDIEIYFNFPIKPFFYLTEKVSTKMLKSFYDEIKGNIQYFWRGFNKAVKNVFLEGESVTLNLFRKGEGQKSPPLPVVPL